MKEKLMEYKGYHGDCHYSEEDACFFGDIVGIRDIVSFEGKTVAELKKDFKRAVDDYLSMCEGWGLEPDKEYRGSFNVRVGSDKHREASLQAISQGKSLNQYVSEALSEKIERDKQSIKYEIPVSQLQLGEEAAVYGTDKEILERAAEIIEKYKKLVK